METSSPAPHPSFYSWTKRSPERKSDLLKAQGHAREELDLAPRASLLLHHLGATNMMRVLGGGCRCKCAGDVQSLRTHKVRLFNDGVKMFS